MTSGFTRKSLSSELSPACTHLSYTIYTSRFYFIFVWSDPCGMRNIRIAVVPLITKAYGRSPDGIYCYIYVRNNVASIERFALWDGPSMTILLAVSTAMVVMGIKLASKVCSRSKYEPITDGDQYYKALQELLPLAAFPVLFFILQIPALIYHIYM